MKGDKLHIYLRPEDFDFNIDTLHEFYALYCPLHKALFRLGYTQLYIDNDEVQLNDNSEHFKYEIKYRFDLSDCAYVKEAYRKDPEMKKSEYYVTLIEQ